MKKIGVITLHRVCNFGSALQAYALVSQLSQRFPGKVQLIDYIPAGGGKENFKKSHFSFRDLLSSVRHFVGSILTGKTLNCIRQKFRFASFLRRMPCSAKYNRTRIRKSHLDYSVYVTGSDQVWNPTYLGDDYTYLLDFVPNVALKAAYSASFGSNLALSEPYREAYCRLLSEYSRVSVREQSGVEYFRALTGKESMAVLDPTFLMTHEAWRELLPSRKKHSEKFILCYLLSYAFVPYNTAEKIVNVIQSRLGMKVYFIGGIGHFKIGSAFLASTGPMEFLELFDEASFVITNSFHGTCFSINFHKDFISILNPNSGSDDRIRNILEMVHLQNRGIMSETELEGLQLSVDYKEAENELEKKRQSSFVEFDELCHEIDAVL